MNQKTGNTKIEPAFHPINLWDGRTVHVPCVQKFTLPRNAFADFSKKIIDANLRNSFYLLLNRHILGEWVELDDGSFLRPKGSIARTVPRLEKQIRTSVDDLFEMIVSGQGCFLVVSSLNTVEYDLISWEDSSFLVSVPCEQ